MTFRERYLWLSDNLDRWVRAVASVFLGVLVGLVLLQVVARYIFLSPPYWTEEISRYAMIWIGLLGATVSFKCRFDPTLALPGQLNNKVLNFVNKVIRSLTVVIYFAPILWFSFFGLNMSIDRGFLMRHARSMADSLDFSTVLVAVAVPFMIILVLFHLGARWLGDDSRYEDE